MVSTKGKPRLAFERLTQIREAVDIPLVLHGSSGVPDEDVQRAVSMGVCKVNFATGASGPPIPRRYGTVWLMTPRSTIPRNMGAPRGRPSSL